MPATAGRARAMTTEAIVHLRVPAATKARWVRESRAAGMRLTDWVNQRVEGKMKKSSLRIVTAWLLGQADAGVDLNGGIELPYLLRPQLSALLSAAVLADENRPAEDDPFERGGVWHRAVNRLMSALTAECTAMTEHYEYPHGLGIGDGAFRSFMNAVRDMHIDLPSADALAGSDAERKARNDAERAEAIAAYELRRAAATSKWDDDEAYDYT